MPSTPPLSPRQWHARIRQLALPIIFSNISVPLVGAVDTAVVGHLDVVELIGAVALGASIFSLIFWTFGFLRMATSGVVAQAFGASTNNAQTTSIAEVSLTFWRSLLVALLIALAILLLQKQLLSLSLWLLGTPESLNQPTSQYYQIRIWSAPATLANYVVLGVLIGLQRMRSVLVFQLFLNLLNMALDILFVPVLGFGIAGVSFASVISEYAALALGIFLLRQDIGWKQTNLQAAALLQRREIIRLFKLNLNIFVRTLLLVLSFFYFNAKSASLGAVALAANAILMQILHICAYALDGFAHAVETLSGHAWGSKQRQDFDSAVKYSTQQSILVAIAMTVIIALLGPQLIKFFTTQPAVTEVANLLLLWLVALPIISVWCYQLDGIFIGTTHSAEMRNAMFISVLLFFCTAQWLTPHFNNHGLWFSFCIFNLVRAITLYLYMPRIINSHQLQPTDSST